MKCEDLLAALNEYVDGSIEPAVCEQFEEYLAGCKPVRGRRGQHSQDDHAV